MKGKFNKEFNWEKDPYFSNSIMKIINEAKNEFPVPIPVIRFLISKH